MAKWHLITSEYPPQLGGVSDYTHLVGHGLTDAGDEVHVWCPSSEEFSSAATQVLNPERVNPAGVFVHREFGSFSPADLRRVGKRLDQFPVTRRLLVQWVPQGYGYKSMNLPFCLWLWKRARVNRDRVEIMVHEPFLAFGEGSRKQDLAAAAHRVMVFILLKAAYRVWVSIPDWEERLRPFVFGGDKRFGWLPVPSNIPVIDDRDGVAKARAQYASPDKVLIGHFGAYDLYMTELMLELLPLLLARDDKLSVILLGMGSVGLRDRLIKQHPDLSEQIHASGTLTAENLSLHVSACDVMLQPYQDGVSGRRTSVMTALSHGVPVVTTSGKATESCWVESRAVTLTQVGDISAMVEITKRFSEDLPERRRLSAAGRALYAERFDVERTIKALREVAS